MRVGIDTDFLVRLSIAAHPGRDAAVDLRDRHLDAGDHFVLAPQVITEFVHVVTDARRFTKPLSMTKALAVAKDWCDADDVVPHQDVLEEVLRGEGGDQAPGGDGGGRRDDRLPVRAAGHHGAGRQRHTIHLQRPLQVQVCESHRH